MARRGRHDVGWVEGSFVRSVSTTAASPAAPARPTGPAGERRPWQMLETEGCGAAVIKSHLCGRRRRPSESAALVVFRPRVRRPDARLRRPIAVRPARRGTGATAALRSTRPAARTAREALHQTDRSGSTVSGDRECPRAVNHPSGHRPRPAGRWDEHGGNLTSSQAQACRFGHARTTK